MNDIEAYYRDKIAVVTGGASGIGLALLETILSYGARGVVISDVNEENLVRENARINIAYPEKALGIRCDVTNEEEVKRMIEQAAEFGNGRLDFVFNNAGSGFSGRFEEQTNRDWDRSFALNFQASVYSIRAVLPVMRAQGGGHVVNIISGIAFYPMAYQSMYSATKAALNSLTLSLRYEFWDENIRFTSATPGTVATSIWAKSEPPPGSQSPEQSARTILKGVSRNERLVLGDQADIAGAVSCFNPDSAKLADDYLLEVARKRRAGKWCV